MGKLEIHDSFLLLLSVLLFVDVDGSLFLFLLAAAIHELGHYAAIQALGGNVIRLRLTAVGAEMCFRMRENQINRALIAAAGPAASMIMCLGASHLELYAFAGANFLLGIFNLLPIRPLDGGDILACLPCTCGKMGGIVSVFFCIVLCIGGLILAWNGKGIFLLLTGGYLLTLQKNLQKN